MPRQLAFFQNRERFIHRIFVVILLIGGIGLAVPARAQNFTEFVLPDRGTGPLGLGPLDIATGGDGALWFTEGKTGKIGRITTAGVITEFALPSPDSDSTAIAAGPEGNLWFVEDGNKIGRITTGGVVAEFPLAANVTVWDITAGPDGALWFAETQRSGSGPSVGRIGRITTAGVITEFALAADHGGPFGVAAGGDGNLWFIEYLPPPVEVGGNSVPAIGRITPTGVITDFAIPATGSVMDLAAGPDGNVWFTAVTFSFGAQSLGAIGRITPTGVVTKYAIPTVGSDPSGIAAGPDGNLWFTDRGDLGSWIGRVTTAGVITEFPIPTRFGSPTRITAGPDGNLWFTELFANRIGRVTTSGAPCLPSGTTLCLNGARFKVEAVWTTSDGSSGAGRAVTISPDSGYFWFFSSNSPEVLVKALDGCSFNSHYWVFGAGLTNVNVVLKVTDTMTGQVKTYTNAQGTAFTPIQDTGAFACP